MLFNHSNPNSVHDTDGSSVDTAITPPETIPPDLTDDEDDLPRRSVAYPKPSSIVIIRSVLSADVITWLHGDIVLAPRGGFGDQFWECVETDGWLGFRNIASGVFLGRNDQWLLCCSVKWHREHEKFQIKPRLEEGGSVLVMAHWGKLRPVGIKEERGQQRLAMVENGNNSEIVWEFVEVNRIMG